MRVLGRVFGKALLFPLLLTLCSFRVGESKSSLSLFNDSFAPVVIPAVPHAYWSWDRIPTSYHGAPRTRPFNESEIKRLAKYQMVTLEKWYTPCAAQGGYGIPQAPPSCDSEGKAETVFQQLKRLSPNLTTNLYWNSMFDFAFYEAHQGMLDMEAQGQHAFLRDKHGQVVYLCNDGNAYCNVTTFDWTKPKVRELWVQTVLNATAKGVDGIFADHSAQEHINIGTRSKGQHALQLCNGGSKNSNLGHSCWNFTADFAARFNSWHLWATNYTQDVLSKTTGGPVICGPLARMAGHCDPCNFTSVRKAHANRPPGGVVELHWPDPDSCRPSESCLAAYLAATEPGIYLHCTYSGLPHRLPGPFEFLSTTSFPEMDYYLGAPNGSATETFPGSNVWRRFFGDPAVPTVVEWDEGRQRGQIVWAHQRLSAPPPPKPSHERAWTAPPLSTLLREIDSELHLLQSAIHDAEDRGTTKTYLARASLEVGSYYRNVAASDASNQSMTRLLSHYRAFYANAPARFAEMRARSLPLREANDTLALLQRARAKLTASPRRPPLPPRDVHNATVCEGYLCDSAGQPVIPSGFNVWSFPKETGPFDEAVAGINIVTTGLGIDRLLPNNTLDSGFVAQILAELDAALAKNISVHTLGFGSVPKWAEHKWPGIVHGNFTQHGVNFDISNPGVPILMTAGIKAIFNAGIGCHPALGGFILGNEVTFVQSATLAVVRSYRDWLQKRYDDIISSLNAAWGTNFTSFDEIEGQPAKPPGPLVPSSAQWWDWNSFNNGRVTAMYRLMATEIQKRAEEDPRCRDRASVPMTTLKLQDGNEFNGLRQKGIDRSALVDALTWNGCDSGIASNAGLDSKGRINLHSRVMNPPHNLYNPPGGRWGGEGWPLLYNKSRYAADWLGQGAGYTLQHSLAPGKPLYDTEWHSIGTLTWRDEHMSPAYVELSVWFAVYHHLAICVAWYFPREGVAPQPATKFPGSLVGSFATLPGATDTFLRQFMLASALGEVVAAIGRLRPVLWILRSMASDTQDETSTVSLLAVFEAASFLGVPIGFVTEKQLQDGTVPNNEQNIVVIPNSTFVENATVTALQRRTRDSVFLASNTTAMCLRFTPSGAMRPLQELAFLDNLTALRVVPAPVMHSVLRAHLLPQLARPPAWCVEAAAPGEGPVFGVLCRFALVPEVGLVGMIINMNAQPLEVGVAMVRDGKVVAATHALELRTGTQVQFSNSGNLMRSGEVLVLQIIMDAT